MQPPAPNTPNISNSVTDSKTAQVAPALNEPLTVDQKDMDKSITYNCSFTWVGNNPADVPYPFNVKNDLAMTGTIVVNADGDNGYAEGTAWIVDSNGNHAGANDLHERQSSSPGDPHPDERTKSASPPNAPITVTLYSSYNNTSAQQVNLTGLNFGVKGYIYAQANPGSSASAVVTPTVTDTVSLEQAQGGGGD